MISNKHKELSDKNQAALFCTLFEEKAQSTISAANLMFQFSRLSLKKCVS